MTEDKKHNEKNREKTFRGREALFGLLTALAFLLSYLESLVPIFILVPGVKLGLANLVVFAALYFLGWKEAFLLSMVRVVLVSITFGNLFSLFYSLAGALLSFFVMCLFRHFQFGKITVSIAGGIAHNIGQLLTAALLMRTEALMGWLPVLLLSGSIAGGLIGLAGGIVLTRIRPQVDSWKNR